jgi:hypothetical protein
MDVGRHCVEMYRVCQRMSKRCVDRNRKAPSLYVGTLVRHVPDGWDATYLIYLRKKIGNGLLAPAMIVNLPHLSS